MSKFRKGCLICMGVLFGGGYASASVEFDSRVIKNTKGSELTQAALFHSKSDNYIDWQAAYELASDAVRLDHDDVVAHRLLGNMYYKGKGVAADLNTALYHYEEAAENDAVSAYMAGKMYLHGQGVDIDIDHGATLIKKAADMGEPLAQQELAELSLSQSKEEKNQQLKFHLEKSAYYYGMKCAQQKIPKCINLIGHVIENGLGGVRKSKDAAQNLYQMAQELK